MRRTFVCIYVFVALWGSFTGEARPVRADVTTSREIWITVSPKTIVLGCDKGDRVTVHTDIPLVVVDRSAIALNGIQPVLVKADDRGNLVAKFDQEAVESIVAPPTATLTLTGITVDGDSFSGSDSVRVIADRSPGE